MEYVEGLLVCPECNVALIKQLPKEELNLAAYADMVSLMRLDNQVEGAVLKGVLEEQGIHSEIRDFIVSVHQLPEAGMNFWGELLVLEPDYENAKFIITEYMNSLDTGIQDEDDSEDDNNGNIQP